MDDTQFARLIGAIEEQTKQIQALNKKFSNFAGIIYLLIFIAILVSACQGLGLL